jgi:hypothetical protein
MARLILPVVGAVVGGVLGGAPGASMGWKAGAALGYAAGSMITSIAMPIDLGSVTTQSEGPRLGDLKAQASTYGKPIPSVYGSMRLAGNCIWATDKIETRHEESTTTDTGGGKGGGGGGSVTQTSVWYTYSQSFAIAICEGPISGIRSIWANGKLVYNIGSGASSETRAASEAFADPGLRIYLGSEDQTPDSLIEANFGVGNTPAYRGTCYVVFNDLQLADYSNSIPNIEFEVIRVTCAQCPPHENYLRGMLYDRKRQSIWGMRCWPDPVLLEEIDIVTNVRKTEISLGDADPIFGNFGWYLWHSLSEDTIYWLISGQNRAVYYRDFMTLSPVTMINLQTHAITVFPVAEWPAKYLLLDETSKTLWSSRDIISMDLDQHDLAGTLLTSITIPLGIPVDEYPTALDFPTVGQEMFEYDQYGVIYKAIDTGLLYYYYQNNWVDDTWHGYVSVNYWADFSSVGDFPAVGAYYVAYVDTTTWKHYRWVSDEYVLIGDVIDCIATYGQSYYSDPWPVPGDPTTLYYKSNENYTPYYRWPITPHYNEFYQSIAQINGIESIPNPSCDIAPDIRLLWVTLQTSICSIDCDTLEVSHYPYPSSYPLYGAFDSPDGELSENGYAFEDITYRWWGGCDEDTANIALLAPGTYNYEGSQSDSLSCVVYDICRRAGLYAVDVTALQSDPVNGYVTQYSTARSQIEPLMLTYLFEAVESDGVVKFVKRGEQGWVERIPESDLAAIEYGSAMPDTLTMDRMQEMELPCEYSVNFVDAALEYETNSKRAARMTTQSQNKESIGLAVVLSASSAATLAEILLYNAWCSRTVFSFSSSWKYAHLEPTDVIQVEKAGRWYTVRLLDEDYARGIWQRSAIMEDEALGERYIQYTIDNHDSGEVVLNPLTTLYLLDIPLLRDQDDGMGVYAAACAVPGSNNDNWRGAQVYKSNDNEASFFSYGSPLAAAAIAGICTVTNPVFGSSNQFDESAVITVTLSNGTLSSVTEEAVLNGANFALVGDEVIQFKNAVLGGSVGEYTLTGLLRGRAGSEWAMATHDAGERFLLLTPGSISLLPAPTAEYGLARQYRGVSYGRFLDEAATVDFTHNAISKHPLSPVLVGGGRDAAGNITINWTRRSRIDSSWRNNVDVPLGEASEAYEVEIYSNSSFTTVKRTISGLTTANASYTAAQQTTDFGSNQSTVYAIVYQLSAVVGRGFGARRAV